MLNNKNKLLLLILIALVGYFIFGGIQINKPQTKLLDENIESKQLDPRAEVLSAYFRKYNSPFEYQAQDFIDAADEYGVDWKLVPSISGVESTFGKHSYGYNAWGWGIYGDQALGFKSWKDGIYTVTGGLKENYINRGLTEPYSMNRAYAASPTWGSRVSYFMGDLEKFAQGFEPKAKTTNPLIKTAASSAQLAFKSF